MRGMLTSTEAKLNVRQYYMQRYNETKPVEQEWNAGTSMPELVNLVIEGRMPLGADVLDIGCGIGTEAVFLAARGYQVSAVDISADAIVKARELADVYGVDVNWNVADVLHLPMEDQSFDVITDRGCFHCIREDEREQFAAEIARVLRPGGLYVLRCFSTQLPGLPNPDNGNDFVVKTFGVSSRDLWNTFNPSFICEKMELVASFPSPDRPTPYGWYCLWYKV
jgi:ubiquinone/menaquinone biosynthesis C-methylase UbiE